MSREALRWSVLIGALAILAAQRLSCDDETSGRSDPHENHWDHGMHKSPGVL